jgi:hypothetical protein
MPGGVAREERQLSPYADQIRNLQEV